MNNKTLIPVAIIVSFSYGCEGALREISKENLGATIGGVGGALLGASIAGGDNKWLGAAIGGAVGLFAGKMIGQHLDQRDRQALALRTVDVLDERSAGVSTWKSNQSGASANIRTGEITYKAAPKQVKRLSSVEPVPSIKLEKKQYQTTSALRVRSGPGTQYATITTLRPRDVITSAGRTDNGWLMLAKQEVTVGYVHGHYVKSYDPMERAKTQGIDLDSVEVENMPKQEGFTGIDLDKVDISTSTVNAQMGCRDLEVDVTTDQGTEKETTKACQNADGVWELG